jgi:ubiquinone/menaquinone biosynthesis C-methylase UbiE
MLSRVLEPELMDTAEDAREYNAMDHAAVNSQFATDLLAAIADWSLRRQVPRGEAARLEILDLGAGTAQIPIELALRAPHLHITAIDAAESMLSLARKNIAAAGVADRIELVLADAKQLPFDAASFPVVVSNSIVHHIANPRTCFAEAARVVALGGLLFHRDLARPHDEAQLEAIVNTYAADATPYQRKLFADSLRASLTLDEVRELITEFGFAPATVRMTSNRHWTWTATKM